jgi:ribosomal protein S18 acetylase RimI-like enzyme
MGQTDNERQPQDIKLTTATLADLPNLLKVHTAAFRSDQFSNLMLLNRDESAHERLMTKSIEFFLSQPDTKLVQAIDPDGQMLGWSCWVIKDQKEEDRDSAKNMSSEPIRADQKAAPEKKPQESQPTDPTRVLGGLMREDMVRRESQQMGNKKYVVLQALATNPKHQGQGIGTRLVQWGAEMADSEQLPCWAHASPASYSLYERAGFQELGRSDYNLAEWAPGGKEGNRGWGTYTFRYMMRPPAGKA